uniref:Uncharacterized protein n=1 Tax=Onchocerca volvulus TaxID=6282 RepID=A0A8R1XXN0_ONCVO
MYILTWSTDAADYKSYRYYNESRNDRILRHFWLLCISTGGHTHAGWEFVQKWFDGEIKKIYSPFWGEALLNLIVNIAVSM